MPFDPHSHQPVVFKNNGAVFGWLFMAAWMAMLIFVTKAFIATWGAAFTFPIVFFALFWGLSLVFLALMLWAPLVRVEILPGRVLVHEKALLWKRERQFAPEDLSVSDIVMSEGSEGGVSYACLLLLPGEEKIYLASSGSLDKAEQFRNGLMGALKLAKLRPR